MKKDPKEQFGCGCTVALLIICAFILLDDILGTVLSFRPDMDSSSSSASYFSSSSAPTKPNGDPLGTTRAESSVHSSESEEYVYVPRTGSHYHKSSICSGMRDPTKTTLEEAEQRGFLPCEVCYK